MPRIEYLIGPSGQTMPVALDALPFRLGRESTAHLVIPHANVSKAHAELYQFNGQIFIRDLNSSNGTFVNGERVRESALSHGDIIHLAHTEFRFFDDHANADSVSRLEKNPSTMVTTRLREELPVSVLHGRALLQDLLRNQAVRVIFQPIVDLHSGLVAGYEALGRGCSRELSSRPAELFRLARLCDLATELSQSFRRTAIEESMSLQAGEFVFCNLHPDEFTRSLPENMESVLPSMPPLRKLILEVPEEVVADLQLLRELRDQLRSRGVGLAFDDVGSGQSRLAALGEVPPDFLKLDMGLVRGIDDATTGRRDVVRAICHAARALGVAVVAEGIERPQELKVCKELGCQYGQGFLLGHPEFTPTV